MDCQTAREILEVVRPNSNELREPEIVSAALHLESCDQCEELFQQQVSTDAQIGQAIRQVHVPEELKDRLLEVLAAEPQSEATTSLPSSSTVSTRRNGFRVFATTTACLILGVVAWWALPASQEQLVLNNLTPPATDSVLLTEFDQNFSVALPNDGNWTSSRLSLDGPKGEPLLGDLKHTRAIFFFEFPTRHRGTISGSLTVIPKEKVQSAPTETYYSAQPISSPTGQFTSVAWTEGDFVYVCYIQGNVGGQWKAFQQAIQSPLT